MANTDWDPGRKTAGFGVNSRWAWRPKLQTRLSDDQSKPLNNFKKIYWKLTVPVLPSWTSVFPRTLNLQSIRQNIVPRSIVYLVYDVILPSHRGTYRELTLQYNPTSEVNTENPLGSGHISPYIPPLLLIQIQYCSQRGAYGESTLTSEGRTEIGHKVTFRNDLMSV